MAKHTGMSRAQSAAMFSKIEAQKAANLDLERAAAAFRASDPVEQAKTYLRRRGFNVFNANILPGERACCEHIMVGLRRLTPAEVMLMAESHRDRIEGRRAA